MSVDSARKEDVLENLKTIRDYLVKLRNEVAAEAVESIKGDYRQPAKKDIQNLVSIQETIEKVDRAIEDEKKLVKPTYGLSNV